LPYQECVSFNENFPKINQVSLKEKRERERERKFPHSANLNCSVDQSPFSDSGNEEHHGYFSPLPPTFKSNKKQLSRQAAVSLKYDKSQHDRLQLQLNIMLQASKYTPLHPLRSSSPLIAFMLRR